MTSMVSDTNLRSSLEHGRIQNTHKNNVSLFVEISSWLEPVTFVKQIQTANICMWKGIVFL